MQICRNPLFLNFYLDKQHPIWIGETTDAGRVT
jgi:hypothetical protein